MGITPDRRPGPLEEYDEIRVFPNTDPPSIAGSLNYDGTSFKFRDSSGVFDPRTGGSGITESQHRELDTLTHDIDETSFDEVTYTLGKVTSYITWATSGKLLKVREEQFTYVSGKISQVVTIHYDGTGSVHEQITEVLTYSGDAIVSITRTRNT